MMGWGLRMAVSGTVPIVWGIATGRVAEAVWITLTAEAVSWVELKGSFTWRVRTLLAGAALAVLSAVLGSVTGDNLWLGCLCMFGVGFVATLLKNIGDRASGLAICFYLLFIICNAYPTDSLADIKQRTLLVMIGAAWPVLVGMAASAVMPVQEPFRRQIALIWRAISNLAESVSQSDSRKGFAHKLADVYAKEVAVRAAINSSLDFYGQMSDQASKKDNRSYQLVMQRKVASLVAVNVIAMGDEMEHISVHLLDKALRVKAAALFGALREATNRMSVFVLTMNPEEKLLTISQINRLRKLSALIKEYPMPRDEKQAAAIARILHLTDRTIMLLESGIQRIDQMGGDTRVYRSYSHIKTSFVLKPKYLLRNIMVLFHFNTLTFKYALRSAIAVTIALFVYKWYHIDHGYWLPFTLMIIIQPYFGATFKRAFDRVVGTLLGAVAGSLLLYFQRGFYVQEAVLFFTFILMVYYVKKNYAVAAFFITLNLVLLFNIEESYSSMLMVTRALCTIGGALLAIAAGSFLLPTWDKKLVPGFLADAVAANYQYFLATFSGQGMSGNWLRLKRTAESKNSNVFDSYNRYMHEPGQEKEEGWYELITCNVRITRSLNNINTEQEEKKNTETKPATPEQLNKINECLELFNTVMEYAGKLRKKPLPVQIADDAITHVYFSLNEAQWFSLEKIIVELKAIRADFELHESG